MKKKKRSTTGQSKHDAMVGRVARGYEAQGYKVHADLPGYSQPPVRGGRRADLEASRGHKKVTVEVETPSSMQSDTNQRRILRREAHQRGATFHTRVAKSKRRR